LASAEVTNGGREETLAAEEFGKLLITRWLASWRSET